MDVIVCVPSHLPSPSAFIKNPKDWRELPSQEGAHSMLFHMDYYITTGIMEFNLALLHICEGSESNEEEILKNVKGE